MDNLSRIAGRHRQIPEVLLQRARELRQRQTSAEQILWACLRGRRLNGAKFRRQHNIGRFIADFYCHEARLVVELDGKIHDYQVDRDAARNAWMQTNGLSVLRFKNCMVQNDLIAVLVEIDKQVSKHSSP
ncbi:MAG: DUF559 domain-containing protein [Cyanobacteria bacterium P01_F01_bin.4]